MTTAAKDSSPPDVKIYAVIFGQKQDILRFPFSAICFVYGNIYHALRPLIMNTLFHPETVTFFFSLLSTPLQASHKLRQAFHKKQEILRKCFSISEKTFLETVTQKVCAQCCSSAKICTIISPCLKFIIEIAHSSQLRVRSQRACCSVKSAPTIHHFTGILS